MQSPQDKIYTYVYTSVSVSNGSWIKAILVAVAFRLWNYETFTGMIFSGDIVLMDSYSMVKILLVTESYNNVNLADN